MVKVVKDFKQILLDFKPMVERLDPLMVGREIDNFAQRPREAWGNWLLCAVLKVTVGNEVTFSDNPDGDGFIVDSKTGQLVPIEHVSALENPKSSTKLPNGEARIIQAIEKKINKGSDYAKGKILLVFFDGAGAWYRDKVRAAINGKHNFISIYCVGLVSSGPGGYEYTLTHFDPKTPTFSITYKVKIHPSFTSWKVFLLQDTATGVIEIPSEHLIKSK